MTPSHRYHVYMRGWYAGASGQPNSPPDAPGAAKAYAKGYTDGRNAFLAAAATYAREIGYVPVERREPALDPV